jgi:hypothetical protein
VELSPRSDIPCISDVLDSYLFDLRLLSEGCTCPAISLAPMIQEDSPQTFDTTHDEWWEAVPLSIGR